MRKLFKKSLACCLVLALSLCMFAGAISANALTTTPTYSSEAVTVAPGESTTIKFTVADFSEIQGVLLKVYVPAVVASIDGVTAEGFTMVEWDDEEGAGNYQIGSDETGKFVKFMELANFSGVETVAGFTFNIAVTVAADAAEGPAAFPAPFIQATDGETLVSINGQFAEFKVEAPVLECQHANATFYTDDEHDFTAAEGYLDGATSVETAKGSVWLKCPDCGEIFEEELNYHYFYTTGTQNALLEAEILFNFKAQPKHLNSQGAFEDAFFVVDMQKETGRVRNITNVADADYEDGSKPYYVVSMGVAAKEMTTVMTSTVIVKFDGKWWSGYQFNNKLVDYATDRFAKSTDDLEKALLADMLTFGAAAQNHFGFNLTDLATDYLGDNAKYVTTTEPSIVDNTVNPLLTTPDHVGYNAYTLDLGSVITMKLTFRTDLYKGGEDFGALSAVCKYINNAGETVSKAYTDAEYTPVAGKANRWEFYFDGIAAKDMRKMVTCTVENADGQVGYALESSIESVARQLMNNNPSATTLHTVIKAMMNYGDSADAFFNR